jgi:hypothetical protein
MNLSLPPKLVEKLVWVPVSFCKIFIPSYAFDALLINRLTLRDLSWVENVIMKTFGFCLPAPLKFAGRRKRQADKMHTHAHMPPQSSMKCLATAAVSIKLFMLLAMNFSSNKSVNNAVESSFQSHLDLDGAGGAVG